MKNHQICLWRDKLSELWHENIPVDLSQRVSLFGAEERFNAFCVAKDLLQDSSEALLTHRLAGFSKDPYSGYIEFWGVLQAIIIQQDSIGELHYAILGDRSLDPKPDKTSAWMKLREFRNFAAGHPSAAGLRHYQTTRAAPTRATTDRQQKSYETITVAVFGSESPKFQRFNLAEMIDEYDLEGASYLKRLFCRFETLLSSSH